MSLCIPAPEDGSDPPIERMFISVLNCVLCFKRYQFYLKTLPEHTKDCVDRSANDFRHDNCFCECHDKGKYDSSNEPKD